MKYLPLIALFLFCCTAEQIPSVEQRSVPIELMGLKASEMIDITNQYRINLGLPILKTSMVLYDIAVLRSNYMANQSSISHYGFYDGAVQSNANYYGESVSYNYNSATDNIEGFHNSAEHWQMFINPIYEYIAISCNGNYTTVLFAKWNANSKKLEFAELEILVN